MAEPAALPAPSGYAEAMQWLPTVCSAMGLDPDTVTDESMRFVEAGARAALASTAAQALSDANALRALRRDVQDAKAQVAALPGAVLRLLPCEVTE